MSPFAFTTWHVAAIPPLLMAGSQYLSRLAALYRAFQISWDHLPQRPAATPTTRTFIYQASDGTEHFLNHPETISLLFKFAWAIIGPVSDADISEVAQGVRTDCKYYADRTFQVWGQGAPLPCLVADHHLRSGRYKQSVQYAHVALTGDINPIRVLHAMIQLGCSHATEYHADTDTDTDTDTDKDHK
jgi:hypothetical protein